MNEELEKAQRDFEAASKALQAHDYTELIAELRAEGQEWRETIGDFPLFDRAADAIEALVKYR